MESISGYDSFNPKTYIETYHSNTHLYFMEKLTHFWSNVVQDRFIVSGSMLDYGAGPVISRYITASSHLQTIVAAEYLEANRKAIEDWICGDPNSFNWRPVFEYVVQKLEGKSQDEVDKRQIEVRKKIKAVVPCDSKAVIRLQLPSDGPNADEYGPPYDIVMTSLTVETVVDSEKEYKDHVAYLAGLVRPGGYLLMLGGIENTFYYVGAHKFKCFPVNKDTIVESVKEAGLKDIVFDMSHVKPGRKIADSKAFYVMYARA